SAPAARAAGRDRVHPRNDSGARRSDTPEVVCMSYLAALFSLLALSLGLVGLASPPSFVGFIRAFLNQGGLYGTATLRLVFGMAVFLSAPDSRWPGFLYVVGVVLLASAL